MVNVRHETAQDIPQVRAVNEKAFGLPLEADIVDRLRKSCPDVLSMVAEDGGLIIGHIMFSPVRIENRTSKIEGMGLGPMAVLPNHQSQGIGCALVRKGLEILRDRGCPFVIVIGHPDYYPRFRFEPAFNYGIKSEWEGIPDQAFMILVFDRKILSDISGVARYRHEFNETM
jgi:putative acetyltransferase